MIFRLLRWIFSGRSLLKRLLQAATILSTIFIGFQTYSFLANFTNPLSREFIAWWRVAEAEREQFITVQREPCPGAHFSLPADGYIGLFYDDPRGPYSTQRTHQGIDIFPGRQPGVTPIYAAYDGYITREADWVSTVIQRIPSDPLQPDRQIWLYYTHMADELGNDFIEPQFDRGTYDKFVPRGTLLGYIGNYDGNVPSRIGTHLHFSVVLDDGAGRYLNEYFIANTVDPSLYLGFDVDYDTTLPGAKVCGQ